MAKAKGSKTAFVIYSPPFISDAFIFIGFTNEEDARSSFEKGKEYMNKTAGAHIVRLDNLSDEEYEKITGDHVDSDDYSAEEYRKAVKNHFTGYKATRIATFSDSHKDWTPKAASAHGDLPEGVDYQITI